MEPRPDVVVVVDDAVMPMPQAVQYACLGLIVLFVVAVAAVVVVLLVTKRVQSKFDSR
jgi:hypothetical protein